MGILVRLHLLLLSKESPLGIEAAKDYVVNTVTAEPADEGAKLSWTNETSVGVNLIVSYVDKNEKKQIVTIVLPEQEFIL